MKITKGKLMQAYNALSKAQLSKCEVKERIAIVKMLRSVRTEVVNLQSFVTDMTDKNQDILSSNVTQKIVEVNKAINAEADKPAETKDIAQLSKETFERVIESNPDWNGEVMLIVEDVFVKQ